MSGLVPMTGGMDFTSDTNPLEVGQILTGKAKAAIVVRLLLNKGADIPLEDLPEACQEELTKAMGQMRVVDKETVTAVAEEFIQNVDQVGLSFSGGIAGALNALDGKINPMTAARLRKQAGLRASGDPWDRIREMGHDALMPVLEQESIEVAAVVISKLDTRKAADLLNGLPGPRARRIAYAVSQTASVTPAAVDRIGLSLAAQLSARPLSAFDATPVERVGAILNSTTALTREDVLEGLDETDEGFAAAVRKAIFTFENIPSRIAPRDIPRILRDVDQEKLVTAMAGASGPVLQASVDYILENMSGRMADQLRDAIEERGKPQKSELESAMTGIINEIRAMEKAGSFIMVSESGEGDAA